MVKDADDHNAVRLLPVEDYMHAFLNPAQIGTDMVTGPSQGWKVCQTATAD